MKVLHLINTLSAGGAELHLLTLCRYLKRSGMDLQVACLREKVKGSRSLRSDFEQEGIRVINLRADSRYDLRFLGRLLLLLKRHKPHILHSHLPRADIAAALAVRFERPPAFLCSVHGIYRDRWFGPWAAPFMRWAYRNADAVIAISGAVANWLERDLGVCREKIRVIHYGVEPVRFASLQTAGGPCVPRPGPVIGSIGRLESGKGFDCLIRAAEIIRRQLPDVSLRIAGHDPSGYAKTLETLVAELNLEKCVQLVGFQKDISSFLNTMDVFAFASRSEGFGQVVIEAMAAGKPVVASRIPPLTEIVLDGETGLLADPDDPASFAEAILSLYRNPERAGEMARLGQEKVRSYFSAQRLVDEMIPVYERVMSINTGRAAALQ